MTIDTTQPITIPEDARFYCLLGKGKDVHNFLHLGYVDNSDNYRPLLEIGKYYDLGLKNKEKGHWLFHFIFSKLGAVIKSEHKLIRSDCDESWSKDISYSAYEITREQYLHFLEILRAINQEQMQSFCQQYDNFKTAEVLKKTSNIPTVKDYEKKYKAQRIFAYQPDQDDKNKFIYNYMPDVHSKALTAEAIQNTQVLSISHTCRHTVLSFLSEVRKKGQEKSLPAHISSQFFVPYSCKT
ncbi:MAG: hypothetical protein P1U36_10005 [Legionellaceae bacterium]|nr:hypothetical protein [Legionellaceae bacterium]